MKSVLIMMATYNGATYLREQLDSIINQTCTNWKLAVQDDGSTDETLNILKEYSEKDSRIVVFSNDSGVHGPFPNFHSLANRFKKCNSIESEVEEFDYYTFSDQDDIFDSDKLEKMIDSIERKGKDDVPCLVYADMRLIDGDGNVFEDSIDESWHISGKNAYGYFFSHKVFGCNLMMNRALFQMVPQLDVNLEDVQRLSHDNFYAKYAATFGKIWFLHVQLMDYRRHGDNQTAKQDYHINLKRIIDRVFKLSFLAEKHSVPYRQTLFTINMMRELELSNEQTRFLETIEDTVVFGGFKSLRNILRHKIVWGGTVENISHSLIIFLGMQKKHIRKCA